MPTLTITVPAGVVTTRLGATALARWDATHAADDPATKPPRPSAVAAVQEMVRDYLRAVYVQAQQNTAAATAQATVKTVETTAKAEAEGVV